MMKPYEIKDFSNNPAWIIFRLDTQIGNKPVDIYFIMDLPSEFMLAQIIVENIISKQQVIDLIAEARLKAQLAKRIILSYGDPIQDILDQLSNELHFALELVPAPYLEPMLSEIKQDFGKLFYSPTAITHMIPTHASDPNYMDINSREDLLKILPDSYDPCPCNSGKKYKFCCKSILREITECMCEVEDGNFDEALQWLEKARKVVGTTGEIMCREAIVYSNFNQEKYLKLLHECINKFPNHPRIHYINGIELKRQNNLDGAIDSYKLAISLYPTSDQYHLNEAYCNLGSALYQKQDIQGAKEAWEKALFFMPSDRMVQRNLNELIYHII